MNSWTGLIKIVAYISAFIIILQMLISLSFGMVRFVPDQVLGWAGGNMANQVGVHAGDEVGAAAKNAFAARGAVTGAFEKRSQAARMQKQLGNQADKEGSMATQADKQKSLESTKSPLAAAVAPIQPVSGRNA